MTNHIDQLMTELLAQMPELRGREPQLRNALSELLSVRPNAAIDPIFRTELKKILLSTKTKARPIWCRMSALYPLVGAALIVMILIGTRGSLKSNTKPTQVAIAPQETSQDMSAASAPAPEQQLMMAAKTQTIQMRLSSTAFKEGEKIPSKYTCDGVGVNPPLEISDIPAGTQRFVLIVEDPDAPERTFLHWIAWNIPGLTTEIAEGQVPKGTVQGINGAGQPGYVGPCPPAGTHRYIFSLYAINQTLDLPEETTPAELRQIIEQHILGEATLIGTYKKQ